MYFLRFRYFSRRILGINHVNHDKPLRWRAWDEYSLDIVRTPSLSIHIEKTLVSEPPEGITYEWGPSGYITDKKNSDYCIIYTERNGISNYCHWTMNEIPLMLLALESGAKNVVFPDAVLNGELPFQVRWLEILANLFPDKNIMPVSALGHDVDGIIPVNHELSSSKRRIGKCAYNNYHNGRATPYCIQVMDRIKQSFETSCNRKMPKHFWIKRKRSRLKNENAVLDVMRSHGFDIVSLEELTLDEQVQLFSNASVVVGCHGAGLTNLLFCETGAEVIEIGDVDFMHPSYIDGVVIPGRKATRTYFYVLARMKGLSYTFLESQKYIVDIRKLMELLHSYGSKRND
jgi:hypothetical protein